MNLHGTQILYYMMGENKWTHSCLIGLVRQCIWLVGYVRTSSWVLQHYGTDHANTGSESIRLSRYCHSPFCRVRQCLSSHLTCDVCMCISQSYNGFILLHGGSEEIRKRAVQNKSLALYKVTFTTAVM